MRIKLKVVLHVGGRDVQAICTNLAIVLAEIGRSANHEISQAVAGNGTGKREVSINGKLSGRIQRLVHPICAKRNLMLSPDQAEVIRNLERLGQPGTG